MVVSKLQIWEETSLCIWPHRKEVLFSRGTGAFELTPWQIDQPHPLQTFDDPLHPQISFPTQSKVPQCSRQSTSWQPHPTPCARCHLRSERQDPGYSKSSTKSTAHPRFELIPRIDACWQPSANTLQLKLLVYNGLCVMSPMERTHPQTVGPSLTAGMLAPPVFALRQLQTSVGIRSSVPLVHRRSSFYQAAKPSGEIDAIHLSDFNLKDLPGPHVPHEMKTPTCSVA